MARFQPGQSGNYSGKPGGTLNLRTRQAIALFEQFQFDPLEEQIALAKSVRGAIPKVTNGERLEYRKLYAIMLQTLLKYAYPQLRHVEHYSHIEIIQKLQALDACDDAELQQLLAQAEELARAGH